MYQRDETVPIVKAFSTWLYQIAEAASKVVPTSFNKGAAAINTHIQVKNNENKICSVCKVDTHKLQQCDKFKSLQLKRKWDVVKFNHLC